MKPGSYRCILITGIIACVCNILPFGPFAVYFGIRAAREHRDGYKIEATDDAMFSLVLSGFAFACCWVMIAFYLTILVCENIIGGCDYDYY